MIERRKDQWRYHLRSNQQQTGSVWRWLWRGLVWLTSLPRRMFPVWYLVHGLWRIVNGFQFIFGSFVGLRVIFFWINKILFYTICVLSEIILIPYCLVLVLRRSGYFWNQTRRTYIRDVLIDKKFPIERFRQKKFYL